MADETFLLRVTGKGFTYKRRIPGWLAAWLIQLAVKYDPEPQEDEKPLTQVSDRTEARS